MKAMGANSLRIALLASKLQPREDQPEEPPFRYSEEGFRYLDSVMVWPYSITGSSASRYSKSSIETLYACADSSYRMHDEVG